MQETKDKISRANTGRKHTAESKAKSSKTKRDRLEALGDKHPQKSLAYRNKRRRYMLSLGDAHPTKREDVRKKISATSSKTKKRQAQEQGDAYHTRTPEARARSSRNFAVQHNRPTKPELVLYTALDKRSFKLTACTAASSLNLPISADITCFSAGLIIQVDGCMWHACPACDIPLKRHLRAKMQKRDSQLTKYARSQGWSVLRFWEHEILYELDKVVAKIKSKIKQLRKEVA